MKINKKWCFILLNFKNFHSRLKLLRKVNMSQAELAEILDVTQKQVSRLENGTGKPSYDILLKIAEYFCVSLDYLTGRYDDPEYEKFLIPAEKEFFQHPDNWPELIKQYKQDKATNPISLAPVFLRSCEYIRDDRIRSKQNEEPKAF